MITAPAPTALRALSSEEGPSNPLAKLLAGLANPVSKSIALPKPGAVDVKPAAPATVPDQAADGAGPGEVDKEALAAELRASSSAMNSRFRLLKARPKTLYREYLSSLPDEAVAAGIENNTNEAMPRADSGLAHSHTQIMTPTNGMRTGSRQLDDTPSSSNSEDAESGSDCSDCPTPLPGKISIAPMPHTHTQLDRHGRRAHFVHQLPNHKLPVSRTVSGQHVSVNLSQPAKAARSGPGVLRRRTTENGVAGGGPQPTTSGQSELENSVGEAAGSESATSK